MATITGLLNVFGEATIPMIVLVVFSGLLVGKVVVSERERRRLKRELRLRLDQCMRAVEAETALLLFYDQESQEVFADLAIGIDEEFIMKRGLRRGAGVSGKALDSGKPVIVSNLLDDPRFLNHPQRAELEQRGIVSVISVPVPLAHRVVGVVTLSCRRPGHFADEHIDVLKPMVEDIGLQIGRAHVFEVKRTNWET